MQKISDRFVDHVVNHVPLVNKVVLEIGCGDGQQTLRIASRKNVVYSVDPDIHKVRHARTLKTKDKVTFGHGSAEAIAYPDSTFDVVIFSLSFHTIALYAMGASIAEAVRVTKPGGFIVFLQPGTTGNFYQAQILFDAGEGDNRDAKDEAEDIVHSHPALELFKEYFETTSYRFSSLHDFIGYMNPKKNHDSLDRYLRLQNFTLREQRRVSIFQPR
jgi:ubiquinone/menaquinone biosynthesis C-methylase UbiE